MAGIAVHYRKLEKAAKQHSRASEALDASLGLSKNLLLFYAAECKLKFAILKTRRETERIDGTTDDLKLSFGSSGHNLIEGMKTFKGISKADLFGTDESIREWREKKLPKRQNTLLKNSIRPGGTEYLLWKMMKKNVLRG